MRQAAQVLFLALCSLVAQACSPLCNPMDCSPPGFSVPWDCPGEDPGVGCHFLLQGIFLTRNQTQVSCIAEGIFTSWTTREALILHNLFQKTKLFYGFSSRFLNLYLQSCYHLQNPFLNIHCQVQTSIQMAFLHFEPHMAKMNVLSSSLWPVPPPTPL